MGTAGEACGLGCVLFGDELLTPVRVACQLDLPVPVVVGIGVDDMRLFIPPSKGLEVGRRRDTQAYHGRLLGFLERDR